MTGAIAMVDTTTLLPPAVTKKERLAELYSLNILNTPADKYFDRYTVLVTEIFKVPMAAVSLIDEDRQWFKSAVGIDAGEKPFEQSFCVHALEQDMLEVPDTREDDFFRNHPAVMENPFFRFYMGTVLRGPTGQPIGTLFIMDTESRYLSRVQRAWLVTFGQLVQELIIHNQDALSNSGQQAKAVNSRNSVTGLPDESMFSNTLKHLIRRSLEEEKYLAVLHVRLNKMDEIKYVHGGALRDSVVHCLAERLIADDTHLLAAGHLSQNSIGGVTRLPSLYDLFGVVTPIVNRLSRPIPLEGTVIRPNINIGISLCPIDGQTPEDLLERARTALDSPGSRQFMHVFSHDVEATALRRYTIAQHLESALQNKQLTTHYQPLVAVDGSRILGFEALARWHDPVLGTLSPADFVPIAQSDPRLSRQLTEWSLTTVAGELSQWPFRPGDALLRVAVNIPPDQFHEEGFVDRVLGSLKKEQLAPERLTLELTEASILPNVDKSIQTMRELRSHNIHIALDDFGTGYSSLSYLKSLPLDVLKIDKSFIDDLALDARSANLVHNIIRIAHGYGLKIVAEGVEHEAQRALLEELGCDIIQGYLFSRPVEAKSALALLKSWNQTSRGNGRPELVHLPVNTRRHTDNPC